MTHSKCTQWQDPKQHVGLKNQGATCYMNRYGSPPSLLPFFPSFLPFFQASLPSYHFPPPSFPPSLPPPDLSLLQQLYHIHDLRAGLLELDLAEEEKEEGREGGKEGGQEKQRGDRKLLFELQALFALLQTSEMKAADTLPFCQVVGWMDGGREGGRRSMGAISHSLSLPPSLPPSLRP